MCFATNAQIGYLRMLLQEAGYPHRMGSAYAELGATLREQGGTVEDWLWGMSVGRASRLIKRLKWECKLIRSARRKGQSLAEKWVRKFRVGGNWNASAEAEMNRSGDVASSGGADTRAPITTSGRPTSLLMVRGSCCTWTGSKQLGSFQRRRLPSYKNVGSFHRHRQRGSRNFVA